jgi:hypothetical protein
VTTPQLWVTLTLGSAKSCGRWLLLPGVLGECIEQLPAFDLGQLGGPQRKLPRQPDRPLSPPPRRCHLTRRSGYLRIAHALSLSQTLNLRFRLLTCHGLMFEDLTADQLAEYHLAWVSDFGGPSLRYADRYDICGAIYEDLEAMFDDGVSKDDIKLVLHDLATMFDDEEEEKRQWRIRHPIKHAVGRLGWHLQMWGSRPWKESLQ